MPEVLMPRLDPGMQSGKIVEWLKKEGEYVKKGEAILVVEGEKTTFEVEAPDSGVLSKILAPVGTDVEVSRPVAIIGEASAQPQSPLTTQSQIKPESPPRMEQKPTTQADRVIASPAARRLAQEHGVDLTNLSGTGPGGRISREDVLATVQKTTAAASTVTKSRQPSILRKAKLEGIRKTVAERLGFSARTAVPVTLTMEADASKLVNLKNRENHVSFTALVVKAVARALESHIVINSTIEGDEVTTYSDINIAVAVNTEQGLVAPVIQNANKKPAREINSEIDALSQKAKENRLTVEELTGGTFTVTNLGAYDIESFAPVINPPQCAILGLGRVAYKPFAVGDRVSSRPTTLLTLVFDHRIVDGVPAAKFLQELKRNLEEAESLF
ncbi:MAG: dihydrolipoamide acetyltransferase family protein [Candidatus Bathyarchaeia archaeon]|jgi:pyruvate dehydrogenase E2 component (dihydrolipoamide acetyltransferase)